MSPRKILLPILMLLLAAAGGASAQPTPPEAAPAAKPAAEAPDTPSAGGEEERPEEPPAPNSRTLRERLTRLVDRYPPEVGAILWLDPTLLADAPFLARYPELARFVEEHPEILHHSRYYLGELSAARESLRPRSPFDEWIEPVIIIVVLTLVAIALGWFLRTVLDYRRTNRLQRAQAEVHNRIMDRLGSSEELLEYMKTPAGAKYLELQPIRLHAEVPRPPLSRSLWSIQAGVVVGAAALGLLVLSNVFHGESAKGFLAMGIIAMALGVGFIASAAVSIFLSRRLGLWDGAGAGAAAEPLEDPPGLVR